MAVLLPIVGETVLKSKCRHVLRPWRAPLGTYGVNTANGNRIKDNPGEIQGGDLAEMYTHQLRFRSC